MLHGGTVLAVILALSVVLAACGGSAEKGAGGQASETPPTAQPGLDNPQVEPTPAQAAPDAPQVEPAAEATASGDVAASAGDAIDVAEHLRQKTMRMWEAYNTHDLNELKPFYEGNYWKEEEEELRSNMRPFKTFGISIKAEETSPPTEIAPGRWEIRHIGRFPMGSVNMVFIYEEFEGEWLLTYAESQ